MKYFVSLDGEELAVDIEPAPGGYLATVPSSGETHELTVRALSPREFTVVCDGRIFDWVVSSHDTELDVAGTRARHVPRVESERARALASLSGSAAAAAGGLIVSPMPGKVLKLLVSEGDEVVAGAPLVVVEAMKMENELCAPTAGAVRKIFVSPGEAVESGARLLDVS